MGDHTRFPARRIAAGPTPFSFHRPAGGGVPPLRTVEVFENNRPVERGLEQFLVASDTTAFLILRGDTLLYEGYFNYNNFNPLLVGLALQRAVGMPVAAYLEQRLWQPLGMEADGSWSLDSQASGFEKMESGLNGRAVDFAKLGVLFANGGTWQGRQLVPRDLGEGLDRRPHDRRRLHPRARVRLLLVGRGRPQPAGVLGQGRYGQHIYVVPESRLVLVLFGHDTGGQRWPQLLGDLAGRLALRRQGEGRRHGPPQRG